MGRFTSPDQLAWQDWQMGSEEERAKFSEFLGDLQQMNLYAYVRNSPLKYTDPTGNYYCAANSRVCEKVKDAYNLAVEASKNTKLSKSQRDALTVVLKFLGKPGEVNGVTVDIGRVAKGADADTDTSIQYGHTITNITLNSKTFWH